MAETLRLEISGDGFASIQMTDGENRFRTPVIKEWNKKLDTVLENNDVKGLFITGSGKYFSNGIDVAWLSEQSRNDAKEYMDLLAIFIKRILVFPIPTVALMNGHAFGGGAFLALACDFRLMTERGWLCWPETAMGLQIPASLLQVVRAKIPPGAAQREAIIYAKRLTGNTAKALGLVDDVIDGSKMAECGKALVKSALGPKGLGRNIVHQMKKDVYSNVVDFSKL